MNYKSKYILRIIIVQHVPKFCYIIAPVKKFEFYKISSTLCFVFVCRIYSIVPREVTTILNIKHIIIQEGCNKPE
jgi:hypothetical protein